MKIDVTETLDSEFELNSKICLDNKEYKSDVQCHLENELSIDQKVRRHIKDIDTESVGRLDLIKMKNVVDEKYEFDEYMINDRSTILNSAKL